MTRRVISGHGRFNENYLETSGRTKVAHFVVPQGVTITFYAPDGAALDNPVANLIEGGQTVSANQVELKMSDSNKRKPVPTPYPAKKQVGRSSHQLHCGSS